MTDRGFLHYLAGLFDGEGSITVRSDYILVGLAVSNAPLIGEIQRRLGLGSISSYRTKSGTEMFALRFSSAKNCERFFNLVGDKVILKRQKIEEARKYISDIERSRAAIRHIKKKIIELRKRTKLSQRQIAKELGVSKAQVQRTLKSGRINAGRWDDAEA